MPDIAEAEVEEKEEEETESIHGKRDQGKEEEKEADVGQEHSANEKQDKDAAPESKSNDDDEKKEAAESESLQEEEEAEESLNSVPSDPQRKPAYRLFPETNLVKKEMFPTLLTLPSSALPFLSSPAQSAFSYATLSKFRKWSAHTRDRVCPPASYTASTRASRAIVDAFACVGYASIALARRPEEGYSRALACDCHSSWRRAIIANVKAYSMQDRVSVHKADFYHYYNHAYTTHTPQAVVYIDPTVPSSPSLTRNSTRTDFDYSSPPQEMPSLTTLSSFLSFLLFHPRHPVPMILLKLPTSFDHAGLRKRIEDVNSSRKELREWIRESELGKADFVQFIAMAGAASESHDDEEKSSSSSSSASSSFVSSSSSAFPHPITPADPYDDPSLPRAQSRRQITYLLSQPSTTAHLYQRFKQLIASQLKRCHTAQQLLWQFLHDQAKIIHDDEELYNRMREFYHHTLLLRPECKEIRDRKLAQKVSGDVGGISTDADGRANSRVSEITELIHSHDFPPHFLDTRKITATTTNSSIATAADSDPATFLHCLLDVGCSEGSITSSLAQALNLPRSHAHGCDVRELKLPPSITFTLLSEGNHHLPYSSNQFTIITCLMSLHHIPSVELTLTECYRILEPGGIIILREHDLTSRPLSIVIDVMHGLYARVWSLPPEQPEFCKDYYARYRSREEWKGMMEKVGFKQCLKSPDREDGSPVQGKKGGGGGWRGGGGGRGRGGGGGGWDGRGGGDGRREDDGFIVNPFEFYYGLYEKPVMMQGEEEGEKKRKRERDEEVDDSVEKKAEEEEERDGEERSTKRIRK